MELEFNEYNFVHPPSLDNAQKHALANRIFKATSPQNQQRCHCCDRLIGLQTPISYSCYNTKQLLFLGPGIPLYFLVIRQSSFILLASLGIFGIFSLVSNYMGIDCENQSDSCSNNILNKFSMLNNTSNQQFLSISNYLILSSIVVMLVILQLIRKESSKLAHKASRYIDLPSDYSMMLRRLPEQFTEWDIEQMIEERRGTLTKEERDATSNLAIERIVLSYSLRDIINTQEKNIKQFKDSVKTKRDFFPQSNSQQRKLAPLVIVTFQSQASKDFFIAEPTTWDKFLVSLWSAYLPYSEYKIKDQKISIQVAPEPDDIHYQNCGISYEGNILRRIFGKFLVFLLLIAGLGVQVVLKVIESRLVNSTYTLLISICFSLGVTIINFILSEVLELITKRQRLETVTEQTISMAATLSILQFINSGIMVMFSNIIVSKTSMDGLAENMVTIMIINMFVPHLTVLFMDGFKPIQRFKRWRINKSDNVYIQKQVNEAYQGSDGKIALRCVYVVKTIWLALFFGGFVPLVIPLAIIGIFSFYFLQKYMYLRHYKIPNMISQTLSKQTIDLLDYSPFLLAAGNFVIYLFLKQSHISPTPTSSLIVIYTSLALTAIYIFLPTDKINQAIFKFKKHQGPKPTYKEVQGNFNTDYDIANPIYQQQNKKKKNEKYLKTLSGEFGNLFSFLCNKGEEDTGGKNEMDQMIEMMNTKKPLISNQGNLMEEYISNKKSRNYGQPPTSDRLPEGSMDGEGDNNESDNFVIRVSKPIVNPLRTPQINDHQARNIIQMNMINLLDNTPMSPTRTNEQGHQNLNIPMDVDLSGMFDYMSPITRRGSHQG